MTHPAPPGEAGPAPSVPLVDSLLQQIKGLARELPGLVSDRVELLSLELHRAAQSLLQILALTVVIAILGVTVWFALWAALITLLVQVGMPLLAALLLTAGANGLVIAAAIARVRRLLPRLQLSATRRHLMTSSNPSPETPPDERSAIPAASHPVPR